MRIGLALKVVFVAASLMLIVGNALVLRKNFVTDWREFQTEYFRMASSKTTDPTLREELGKRKPRIEQLIVTEYGDPRVDRCTTCHAGIEDTRFRADPQPFRSHPAPALVERHPFRRFGCTICHGGNGRGLSVEDAHGERRHWEEPLLRGPYLEAGCARCHPSPYLDETPLLRLGAELFKTKACYGCHKVVGVSNGKLGVELTTVGAKWGVDYLTESIVDPKANNIQSLMPKIDLTDREVTALTVYLKSLIGENLVDGPVTRHGALEKWRMETPPDVPVTVESGKAVYETKGCSACHTIEGRGGRIGPDLSLNGLQRTREWNIQHHINPRSMVAGSIMPDFTYSRSELEALALFLSTKRGDGEERSMFSTDLDG